MLARQTRLMEIAATKLRRIDDKHMTDLRVAQPTVFPVGSYVIMKDPAGNPHRLYMPWRGPFQVLSIDGSSYTILDLVRKSERTVHISNLSKFDYDPLRTSPQDVANHDQGEFIIDKIMDHRGDFGKKSKSSSREFLVHWLGFPHSADSWEPWSGILRTTPLHEYLRTINKSRLIPREYRNV